MFKSVIVLATGLILSGCAGTSTYTVKPFVNENTGELICCEASVTSSRDVGSVEVHATKTPDGNYTLTFDEKNVSASGPISAQAANTSAISNAVSNTAAAVVKLTP